MRATAYQRLYRLLNPEVARRDAEVTNARSRALTALARKHPDEYRELWEREVGRPRRRAGRKASR